ncbi:MAG: DegT/DnrJ/EryC1/StrS family aminotransferase [Promethearchaeota archaeon]
MKSLEFPPVKYDLQTRFGSIYDYNEKQAILECLYNDAPTCGEKVAEFEKKFAEFCGTKHAIAVSNGTAALMMAFKAIGIKPGDEVITTPITWIATAAAAAIFGAKIKFADTRPDNLNIDPETIEPLINQKTKAICPVHLYGQPVDMDPIMDLAEDHDLHVIEDAAHAPGAEYKKKKVGAIGHVSCFSFHEQKNMSTLGEGGMIVTNDDDIAEKARLYKSHCARVFGPSTKYLQLDVKIYKDRLDKSQFWFQDFDDCGYNFRMADMPAAVGLCQLKKINKLNKKRREIASYLEQNLAEIDGIQVPHEVEHTKHVYHLFPIFLDEKKVASVTRDLFILKLRQQHGIKVGVHYMPLVLTKAFKVRGHEQNECPVACTRWLYLMTLPCHPRLEYTHLDYMISAIKTTLNP